MNFYRDLRRHFIVYLFPPLLIIANYFGFNFFVSILNRKEGYLLAMIFYWLFCLLAVFLWIRKPNRKLLLRIKHLSWWQVLILIIPVALAFGFGPFKDRIVNVTPLIIFLSFGYAVINAFCEEFLWRGLYYDHHPANFFYAVIVPTFWFGVWHYAPLSVQPSNIGNFYFILIAMGLGFCWSIVTYYTRSIFWSIVSHILVDFSGLGILYYVT